MGLTSGKNPKEAKLNFAVACFRHARRLPAVFPGNFNIRVIVRTAANVNDIWFFIEASKYDDGTNGEDHDVNEEEGEDDVIINGMIMSGKKSQSRQRKPLVIKILNVHAANPERAKQWIALKPKRGRKRFTNKEKQASEGAAGGEDDDAMEDDNGDNTPSGGLKLKFESE